MAAADDGQGVAQAERVGERPGVAVAGVRWHQLSLTPRDEGEVPPEEEVPVVTELVLENVAEGSARVLVILLLEDDDHNALQRLELEPVKVRPERLVEESQKSKVLGSALLQATGVYVFVEVER